MEINFDEDEIERRLRERKAKKMGKQPSKAEPTVEELEEVMVTEHYLTPDLHKLIELREHTWLPGPAGAGKSKAIELAATKLEMRFFCPPIGRETTSSQLMGYFNAGGEYVRTPLREALENGGIVHFEEFDFASAAVGTAVNAVLANDKVGFPDKVVDKHPDFIVLASANTFGTGANATYIGSQGLNAATLDRFVFLEWGYDEKLERAIAPNRQWTGHVQTIRAKVAKLGLKTVISPRASIKGGKMINTKHWTFEQVEKMVLWKGLDTMTVQKIITCPL
jgi:MoxR-like ATPase